MFEYFEVSSEIIHDSLIKIEYVIPFKIEMAINSGITNLGYIILDEVLVKSAVVSSSYSCELLACGAYRSDDGIAITF